MAAFVFVHGAWHGAWCWERVLSRLNEQGHTVTALDLPGVGADTTPPAEVTLDSCAARVLDALSGLPEPAILIGHSLGGVTITRVAEQVPELVRRLGYLAAVLPDPGESAVGMMARLAPEPPVAAMTPSADGLHILLSEPGITEMLYGQCLPDDAAWAKSRLRPQPIDQMVAPVQRTVARFGHVPRTYIECTQDRALPIAAQRAMIAANPGTEVLTMEADHSPFLSHPGALTRVLLRLTEQHHL